MTTCSQGLDTIIHSFKTPPRLCCSTTLTYLSHLFLSPISLTYLSRQSLSPISLTYLRRKSVVVMVCRTTSNKSALVCRTYSWISDLNVLGFDPNSLSQYLCKKWIFLGAHSIPVKYLLLLLEIQNRFDTLQSEWSRRSTKEGRFPRNSSLT